MTEQWSVPAYAVLVLVVLLTAVLAVRAGSRARRADERLAVAESEAVALRESVTAIERRLTLPAPPEERSDYVITRVGDRAPAAEDRAPAPVAEERAPASVSKPPLPPVVAPPLFADLVLRESVVQAASLATGLRRALAPETRHRIRFEMRREVKRARKQRRSDLRAARRSWEEREREATGSRGPRAGEGSAA